VSHLAKTRIPISVGNLVEVAGILLAAYLILMAPEVTFLPLKLIFYLLAWGCMEFFPHGLAHYVVGILVGVKFRHYSLGKSPVYKLRIPILSMAASTILVLRLNVNQESLGSVGRGERFAMFSSGAIASVTLPFIVALASFRETWVVPRVVLLILSAANLAFDLYFSPKVGDISRASKAGRFAICLNMTS
jgi:hypothetical protein